VIAIADEIIVVDSFSSDSTMQIAAEYNKVKAVLHKFEGHIQQKNYAVSLASFDYVLSLDADELLSPALAAEILTIKLQPVRYNAYEMPRLNNYCGQWIRHSGWYPDKKIRLWDKNLGNWGGTNPHDKVVLEQSATVGTFSGDLRHYTMDSVRGHIAQERKFAKIAANELMVQESPKNGLLLAIANPPFTFLKKYVLQLGFLDGWHGITIAAISAYGKFLKYWWFFRGKGKKNTLRKI
jgi:glycosyltransferase involved in cell wall biosynthesis